MVKFSTYKTTELANKTVKCLWCDEFITIGDMYAEIGGQFLLRCPVCGGRHTEEEIKAAKKISITELWNDED